MDTSEHVSDNTRVHGAAHEADPERAVRSAFKSAGIPGTVGQDPCVHRASPTPLLHISIPIQHGPVLAALLAREPEQ